jgi:hypothetical protein
LETLLYRSAWMISLRDFVALGDNLKTLMIGQFLEHFANMLLDTLATLRRGFSITLHGWPPWASTGCLRRRRNELDTMVDVS